MGGHLTCQPLLWHSSTIPEYLALFLSLSSSIRSFQCMVSSRRNTWLEATEVRTMSGLSIDWATASQKFSELCHCQKGWGRCFRLLLLGFSPACCDWSQSYYPSPRAFEQQLTVGCVPRFLYQGSFRYHYLSQLFFVLLCLPAPFALDLTCNVYSLASSTLPPHPDFNPSLGDRTLNIIAVP